ncbi:hypothetical protein Vadar_011299 [Vaccinium darrowii]|uniref:Uncharacterized protein n=1 Tax=Vaccinium darrowii TaxID=229202 RepID=A0ACB7ZBW2_9ERIC|nr:hypothetical protein Vadar_011299 [Vaccinium darrowii]
MIKGYSGQWYQWFEKTQKSVNWKEFEYGLSVRFGPNVYEDAIGELTKLCQTTIVKCYQERFEELANRTSGLTQGFFISCLLSGLKEEIRVGVQMFGPTTITQAIGLARLQEETTEAIARKSKTPTNQLEIGTLTLQQLMPGSLMPLEIEGIQDQFQG